ncbi:1172_t:CDS:1, partial [Racocetra fulgida]
MPLPNILSESNNSESNNSEFKAFCPQSIHDKYAWRCFAYFVLIKWFVTIFTSAYAVVLMAFWFLPPCLPLS